MPQSPMAWGLFALVALLSYLVQMNLKRKFARFARVPLDSGLSGAEVARRMLADHGITDVQVISVAGHLTDHFNPLNKTVNLSESVYNERSVAAAAVAAHECGHAVQHAVAYGPLKMRSALVPVVSFSSKWVQWIILAGIVLIQSFPALLLVGIALFATTTLFSFVTLPVEIDASKRATAWLREANVTSAANQPLAISALRAAAYTYVVAALSSLATLIYYLSIYLSRRRD